MCFAPWTTIPCWAYGNLPEKDAQSKTANNSQTAAETARNLRDAATELETAQKKAEAAQSRLTDIQNRVYDLEVKLKQLQELNPADPELAKIEPDLQKIKQLLPFTEERAQIATAEFEAAKTRAAEFRAQFETLNSPSPSPPTEVARSIESVPQGKPGSAQIFISAHVGQAAKNALKAAAEVKDTQVKVAQLEAKEGVDPSELARAKAKAVQAARTAYWKIANLEATRFRAEFYRLKAVAEANPTAVTEAELAQAEAAASEAKNIAEVIKGLATKADAAQAKSALIANAASGSDSQARKLTENAERALHEAKAHLAQLEANPIAVTKTELAKAKIAAEHAETIYNIRKLSSEVLDDYVKVTNARFAEIATEGTIAIETQFPSIVKKTNALVQIAANKVPEPLTPLDAAMKIISSLEHKARALGRAKDPETIQRAAELRATAAQWRADLEEPSPKAKAIRKKLLTMVGGAVRSAERTKTPITAEYLHAWAEDLKRTIDGIETAIAKVVEAKAEQIVAQHAGDTQGTEIAASKVKTVEKELGGLLKTTEEKFGIRFPAPTSVAETEVKSPEEIAHLKAAGKPQTTAGKLNEIAQESGNQKRFFPGRPSLYEELFPSDAEEVNKPTAEEYRMRAARLRKEADKLNENARTARSSAKELDKIIQRSDETPVNDHVFTEVDRLRAEAADLQATAYSYRDAARNYEKQADQLEGIIPKPVGPTKLNQRASTLRARIFIYKERAEEAMREAEQLYEQAKGTYVPKKTVKTLNERADRYKVKAAEFENQIVKFDTEATQLEALATEIASKQNPVITPPGTSPQSQPAAPLEAPPKIGEGDVLKSGGNGGNTGKGGGGGDLPDVRTPQRMPNSPDLNPQEAGLFPQKLGLGLRVVGVFRQGFNLMGRTVGSVGMLVSIPSLTEKLEEINAIGPIALIIDPENPSTVEEYHYYAVLQAYRLRQAELNSQPQEHSALLKQIALGMRSSGELPPDGMLSTPLAREITHLQGEESRSEKDRNTDSTQATRPTSADFLGALYAADGRHGNINPEYLKSGLSFSTWRKGFFPETSSISHPFDNLPAGLALRAIGVPERVGNLLEDGVGNIPELLRQTGGVIGADLQTQKQSLASRNSVAHTTAP